jgi:hypothetical protein
MPRPYVPVPPALIRTTNVTWKIDWREQSTGNTLDGRPGIGAGRFPRWVGSPSLVLHGPRLPQFRAVLTAGRGALGVYRVMMFDPLGGHQPLADALGWSDSTTFSDGAGFEDIPVIPCVGGAAAGATELIVDEALTPAPIQIGQLISHNGPAADGESPIDGPWPMIVLEREALTGTQVRLRVEMPLRTAITDGAPIDLIASGLFLSLDGMSAWPDYGLDRVARPTWPLVEYLR